jgi:hypothetical protein
VVAKQAEEGNLSSGDSQIARRVLEADFFNKRIDPNSLADSFTNQKINQYLPLNNRPELERMKELNNCHEPGIILYFEFDTAHGSNKEIDKLSIMDSNYLNNGFTFRINVKLITNIGNT